MADIKHPYGGMPFHGSVVIRDGKKIDYNEAYPDSPRTIEEALRRVGALPDDMATMPKSPVEGPQQRHRKGVEIEADVPPDQTVEERPPSEKMSREHAGRILTRNGRSSTYEE